jgi:CRISPR-associated endonuclease Csn1
VERQKYKIPVIVKNPHQIWEVITESGTGISEEFLQNLPAPNWQFVMSMQQNEMFLLNPNKEELSDAVRSNDLTKISYSLYRVQKIAERDYNFRHHLETQVNDDENLRNSGRYIRISSIPSLKNHNPIKLKINHLGEITELEESII